MVTAETLPDVPSAAYAAHHLNHLTTSDLTPGHTRRPTFDEARKILDHSGIRDRGRLVVIAVPDAVTQLTLFLAAHHQGLVPVLLPRASSIRRTRLIADSLGAAALVVPTPHDADTRSPGLPRAVAHHPPYPQHYPPDHAIVMTSGTSGLASGCLHRISSLYANARRHAQAVGLREDDTVFVNMPLHFSYALVAQALAALITGARLVLGGPPFTPTRYIDSLRRHDVTVSSLSPSLVRTILAGDHQLPSVLRVLTVGGDALEEVHTRSLLQRQPATELYLTYGLTEAGPRVATLAAHREPDPRLRSVGLPLPGVHVGIRPQDPVPGRAPDRTEGELVVTTPTALVRHVGPHADARRGLIAPRTIATGDIFAVEDGYLYFRGRARDFIIVNGDKLSLRWIRELVGALPGVLHVRTTPRPGPGTDSGQRYDLDITASETTPQLKHQVHRALKEILLRAEWPETIRYAESSTSGFTK
ncbi:coronafacic acid synthetase [Streptomyces spiroverticillatus]|uniref:Coronafacic acid synthetase n=1 Tax=Streptomyces finlayi TaxID=67296 RepID=A0A919CFV7_9ACTN|nr:class I adenylate-forming enzyme family protein [Streptomyces finlayi]GHA49493.1 coronafacic acid synthetase [Streptomyces spiroverticillatus]GHD19350.1 coronafacic acid synthetase [Streptomyces finlayi]